MGTYRTDSMVTFAHNSTSAISQLLLNRFWSNFKQRFLGTYATEYYCHHDICPGNICPGDICPYQQYKYFQAEHFRLQSCCVYNSCCWSLIILLNFSRSLLAWSWLCFPHVTRGRRRRTTPTPTKSNTRKYIIGLEFYTETKLIN